MRILVIGAGAVGGYFGGRLTQAGRDVTFLVRPARAAVLAERGLVLRSPAGDFTLAAPQTVQAGAINGTYDLVILSCKAYDLDSALDSLAPAVGPETTILPLLNGRRHLELLDGRLGPEKVLGGFCVISATLNAAGEIVHFLPGHVLNFGERAGGFSARVARIGAVLDGVGFEARASDDILAGMWEKWVMLAALAGATTLMRAAVGDIARAPGGADFVLGLIEECRRVAALERCEPRAAMLEKMRARLTDPASPLTASMYRDICNGGRIEADHIIGDLLARGETHGLGRDQFPRLGVVYTHLKAYENKQFREGE